MKPLNYNVVNNSTNASETKKIFELIAPNKFTRDHIKKNYADVISSVLADVIGGDNFSLNFSMNENVVRGTSVLNPLTESNSTKNLKLAVQSKLNKTLKKYYPESNLNQSYNFSNFVVGACNQFAYAVSMKVAENMGAMYNPLFLYGGVGLGKTHLVNAIGNTAIRRGKRGLFISAEYFLNELYYAIRSKSTSEFKNKFRSLDFLIIDDVQFFCGKEMVQEEMFHTFNELYQRNKQIIITADRLPQELTGLEDRLRTRFSCGLSVDLQRPDFETRVAILMEKAEAEGLFLSSEVTQYLAEQIDTNVRELEGALNRLKAMSSLNSAPIDLALATNSLGQILTNRHKTTTVLGIQEAISQYFRVGIQDLLGKRRTSNVALARQTAMYLCRALTAKSFPEIGSSFGGRDHSTVIHACKAIEKKIDEDKEFAGTIEAIKKGL
jgi:chromosomal replication initiator protein